MKKLLILVLILSCFTGILSAQTLDNYGGWISVNDTSGHPSRQSIVSASQTGTVKTVTVTNGAAFANNEPMCMGGTSSLLDYVYDGTHVNAGADKITNITGNVLTLTARVSHSVSTVTIGWIEPCKFFFYTTSGSPGPIGNGPKFMTPFYHNFFWDIEIGGADYSTSTLPTTLLTARYGGAACTAAQDDLTDVLLFGFNSAGMDSFELYPTGGGGASCSSLTKVPFSNEAFSGGYAGTNVFSYAPQPVKNMDEGIISGSYASNCPVRRGQYDYFDPAFTTFINAFMLNDTSIEAYFQSPYFTYLKTDDVGIDGAQFSGSAGEFPTLPRGHNDCDAAVLIAIASPYQAVSNHACCYGNPAPPFMYPDPVVYTKKLSTSAPGSCTVALPCSWPDWVRNKYTTIGAANTAWGSSYTTFGSSGSTITGESLGTGDGSTLTFSGTLAHTLISPFSVQIFSGATEIAGSYPTYARSSGGTNTFKGTNVSTGSINFATGVWSVTMTAGHAPANLAAITANYAYAGWPVSVNGGTGLVDEDGTNTWVPTQPICVARPSSWVSLGVVSPNTRIATTSPATWQYTILGGTSGASQPTWSSTIGNAPTPSLDGNVIWISGGPGVCQSSGGDFSPAPNGNLNYVTDLETYLGIFGGEYGKVNATAIKTPYPDSLWGFTDGMGDYWTPPRAGALLAAQQWADLGEPDGALDTTQDPLANVKMSFETSLFSKPLLSYTNIYSTDASLPTPAGVGYPNFATQPLKAAYWGTLTNYFQAYISPSNSQTPFVGIMQWFMGDTQGANGGLKTSGAGCANSGQCYNFYNGHEDASGTVNCSPPFAGLTNCGGESGAANFLGQDAITATTAANATWKTGGGGGPPPPGPIPGDSTVIRSGTAFPGTPCKNYTLFILTSTANGSRKGLYSCINSSSWQIIDPFPVSTVSGLPVSATPAGSLAIVTDGTSSTDCVTGGGGAIVLCRDNGTVWIPFAGALTFDALKSAIANLVLNDAGFTLTINQTSAVTETFSNTAAATSSVSQSSPFLALMGNGWSGLSVAVTCSMQNAIANATAVGTMQFNCPVVTNSSGQGAIDLSQGTGNALPSNTAGFDAPTSVPSAYRYRLPSAGPSSYGPMKVSTTSAGISQVVNGQEPQLTWGAYYDAAPNSTGAAVYQNKWTVPLGVTAVQFDVQLSTAPVGCSPYATIALYDLTASSAILSVTFTTGVATYTSSGSVAVTGGHVLVIKPTTAQSGCSTAALGIHTTLSYTMQN